MAAGAPFSVCAIFEILVVLFQVCGIMGLCLNRLMPRSTRWSSRGQVGSIVALFGLGIAGALCGRHDSEFALFAGGTMTVLLIGMTMGSGAIEMTEPARPSCDDRAGARRLRKSESPQLLVPSTGMIFIGADRPRFFLAAI